MGFFLTGQATMKRHILYLSLRIGRVLVHPVGADQSRGGWLIAIPVTASGVVVIADTLLLGDGVKAAILSALRLVDESNQ